VQCLLAEHPEIFARLESHLHLRYVEKDIEGNVCLIDSEEVRPEFKGSFTTAAVVNYLYGSFHLALNKTKSEKEFLTDFPYPDNSEIFWELMKSGEELNRSSG
jgi:hypothetical protein